MAPGSTCSGTGQYPGTALSSSCSPLLLYMFVLIFPLSDFKGAAFSPTDAMAASWEAEIGNELQIAATEILNTA